MVERAEREHPRPCMFPRHGIEPVFVVRSGVSAQVCVRDLIHNFFQFSLHALGCLSSFCYAKFISRQFPYCDTDIHGNVLGSGCDESLSSFSRSWNAKGVVFKDLHGELDRIGN